MKAEPPKNLSDTDDNSTLPDAKAVSQYLLANPDFFIGRNDLIQSFIFEHDTGAAISLVERQIKVLRESNSALQDKLVGLVTTARDNDALFEKIRLVVLALLRSSTLSELNTSIASTLSANFSATASKLLFISDITDAPRETLSLAAIQQTFGDVFDKKRTFCGPIEGDQATLLFQDVESNEPNTAQETNIISAAIVPIHISERLSAELGIPLLVIGSNKADHFNSSLDTLFLDFIGEVLSTHITQLATLNQNEE